MRSGYVIVNYKGEYIAHVDARTSERLEAL